MDKVRLIQNWAVAGIKDFYISFEFESENKWHEYSTFFCAQGLEKISKAYILARSASSWEHLPEDKGSVHVNKMAEQLGHNLRVLLNCLQSRGVLPVQGRSGSYSQGELIGILEAAYIEVRYPFPKNSRVHRRFPSSKGKKGFADPLKETAPIKYARSAARAVLRSIESEFSIGISKDKTCISNRIPDEYWVRFQKIFFE